MVKIRSNEKIKIRSKSIPGFSTMTFSAGHGERGNYGSKGVVSRIKIKHDNGKYEMRSRIISRGGETEFDTESFIENDYLKNPDEIIIDLLGDCERLQMAEGLRFIADILEDKLEYIKDGMYIFELLDETYKCEEENEQIDSPWA